MVTFAGLPWFASFFLGMFKVIAGFVGVWLTKKLAYGVAAIGVFGAMTVALYGVLSLALQGIAATLPAWPGIEMAMYMAAPPNLPAVVAATIAADSAFALYRWNVENLKILSYIT